MSKPYESEIKLALTNARYVSDARSQRAKYTGLRHVDLLQRSQARTTQRALDELVGSYLRTTGFDADKFERIAEQHQSQLRLLLEERKAEAVKHSSSEREILRSRIDRLNRGILEIPPPPKYEFVDTPFLIWGTQGIDVVQQHVEPHNSQAKFKLHADSVLGYDEMGFYFLWENPSDRYAVVNVDTSLIAVGSCEVASNGGFAAGLRRSSLSIQAELHLMEWWNQPPTEPMKKGGQTLNVASLATETGSFGNLGAFDYMQIFQGSGIYYNLFLLPPNGVVVLEVTLAMAYESFDGFVDVDFATGDFVVECPSVRITTLT